MIQIRAATEDDREALVALALPFAQLPPYDTLLAALDHTAAIHRRLDHVFSLGDYGVVFVAIADDGALVGCLALVAARHDLTDALLADELAYWVLPGRRSGAAGYHLLRSAEEWAHARGVKTLRMFAPIGSRLGTLYTRSGYQALETTHIKVLT